MASALLLAWETAVSTQSENRGRGCWAVRAGSLEPGAWAGASMAPRPGAPWHGLVHPGRAQYLMYVLPRSSPPFISPRLEERMSFGPHFMSLISHRHAGSGAQPVFAERTDQRRLAVESATRSGSEALLVPAPERLEALDGSSPNLSMPRASWQAAGFCVLAGARHSYMGLPFGDT